MTTGRMHAYYQTKKKRNPSYDAYAHVIPLFYRDELYRKMGNERISIDANVFDKDLEYGYETLKFKVVRFAMDKIRENTIYSLRTEFVTRGENCNCADRFNYKLPCPCVTDANSNVLSLEVVDKRWRLEFDVLFDGLEDKYSLDKTDEEKEEKDNPKTEETSVQHDDENDVVSVLSVSDEKKIMITVSYYFRIMKSSNKSKIGKKNRKYDYNFLLDDHLCYRSDRIRLMLKVAQVLHKMYSAIADFSTQQQIADALTVLEEATDKILNPAIKIDQLKSPTPNSNRKGRPFGKGIKSGTKRLQIAKEFFEESQKKDIKKERNKKKKKIWKRKDES
ncbi:uncharacterized protein EV154DRAFT_485840 [Mucor mucedo]|uniref:uncharacterized protein n=1 Tax=Mucor mucedo TaxID=29922 RepID=UPI00221E962B|nr:uncharacterized protein EV154DRAFT_485840 [Mucor mucedo]KAI7880894.1 hypothetical protein EV154DRAFT_485840 [Mucor mucedo]